MPTFDSNGVGINYVLEGRGPTILLVHGFASSLQGNWRVPGIFDALVKSGRKVVALDCRGHGDSDKPHDPEAYADNAMPNDVIALMDHLGIEKTDLMGYSMGGMISATLLTTRPERFRSVILSGVGDALASGGLPRQRAEAIARAMESTDSGKGETRRRGTSASSPSEPATTCSRLRPCRRRRGACPGMHPHLEE